MVRQVRDRDRHSSIQHLLSVGLIRRRLTSFQSLILKVQRSLSSGNFVSPDGGCSHQESELGECGGDVQPRPPQQHLDPEESHFLRRGEQEYPRPAGLQPGPTERHGGALQTSESIPVVDNNIIISFVFIEIVLSVKLVSAWTLITSENDDLTNHINNQCIKSKLINMFKNVYRFIFIMCCFLP